MNRLLSIGLLSILTIVPLFSNEPYVVETFEEKVEFFVIDENLTEPMEEALPISQRLSVEEVVEEQNLTLVDENSSEEKKSVTPFEAVVKKAKDENKLIMIAIRATNCHYCDRMESETLSDAEVKEQLEENFITFHVNQDETELPLELQPGMTPNFVFVNSNEDVMDMAPGLRTPTEFLEVLERILKQSN